ncbi:MAG: hypothetical protein WKF31_09520 [Thermoleophilaceae bacterium]
MTPTQVARPRSVAVDERPLVVGPSHDGDREEHRVGGDHVAAGHHRAGALGERLHPVHHRERPGGVGAPRQREADVGLARLGPHRGEIRERRGQRLVADVGGAVGRQLEVDPVGREVGRGDRHAPGPDHRGVVARPPEHARSTRAEAGLDRRYELELTHGSP